MKKRVLALILASVITLTNGNIAFAAEADIIAYLAQRGAGVAEDDAVL